MVLQRYSRWTLGREILLLAVGILWLVPFFFMFTTSLKSNAQLLTSPLQLPSSIHISNYVEAWQGSGGGSLGSALVNSGIVTGVTVLLVIALGSLCGYVIARRPGRLGLTVYLIVIVSVILPDQAGVVPIYVVLRSVDLVGTLQGVILQYIGRVLPLSVFLYTGFIRRLPRDYEEAAHSDGAGVLRTFIWVVFPLLRPVSGTVAIFVGFLVWNDFFFQLILLGGSGNLTVPVAIYSFVGQYASQWNLITATVTITIAPLLIFYFVAQRHLIRGFASGVQGG